MALIVAGGGVPNLGKENGPYSAHRKVTVWVFWAIGKIWWRYQENADYVLNIRVLPRYQDFGAVPFELSGNLQGCQRSRSQDFKRHLGTQPTISPIIHCWISYFKSFGLICCAFCNVHNVRYFGSNRVVVHWIAALKPMAFICFAAGFLSFQRAFYVRSVLAFVFGPICGNPRVSLMSRIRVLTLHSTDGKQKRCFD